MLIGCNNINNDMIFMFYINSMYIILELKSKSNVLHYLFIYLCIYLSMNAI